MVVMAVAANQLRGSVPGRDAEELQAELRNTEQKRNQVKGQGSQQEDRETLAPPTLRTCQR